MRSRSRSREPCSGRGGRAGTTWWRRETDGNSEQSLVFDEEVGQARQVGKQMGNKWEERGEEESFFQKGEEGRGEGGEKDGGDWVGVEVTIKRGRKKPPKDFFEKDHPSSFSLQILAK